MEISKKRGQSEREIAASLVGDTSKYFNGAFNGVGTLAGSTRSLDYDQVVDTLGSCFQHFDSGDNGERQKAVSSGLYIIDSS